jgi:hypothetical protein
VCLSPESFRIALITELPETPRAYCDLSNSFFDEFRVNSQAADKILLELGVDLLLKALSSVCSTASCEMKLAKRDGQPCLSLISRSMAIEVRSAGRGEQLCNVCCVLCIVVCESSVSLVVYWVTDLT